MAVGVGDGVDWMGSRGGWVCWVFVWVGVDCWVDRFGSWGGRVSWVRWVVGFVELVGCVGWGWAVGLIDWGSWGSWGQLSR